MVPSEFVTFVCAEVQSIFRYDPCANIGVSFVFREVIWLQSDTDLWNKKFMEKSKNNYICYIFSKVPNKLQICSGSVYKVLKWFNIQESALHPFCCALIWEQILQVSPEQNMWIKALTRNHPEDYHFGGFYIKVRKLSISQPEIVGDVETRVDELNKK